MRYLLLGLVLLMSGCATQEVPKFQYITVNKEVPVYCNPPAVLAPLLPVNTLKSTSTDRETVNAYTASIVLLLGYTSKLNEILQVCRDPKEYQFKNNLPK